MPNRVIRESLLDSERYWACSIEARELYRHIQLLADDFGCLSIAPAFIGRRCFDTRPTQEKLAGLLQQLSDNDLIRIYEAEGARYAFLPRFGQRLRRMTLKHPKPPSALTKNDPKAVELFKLINERNQVLTDGRLTDDGHMPDPRPAKGKEGNRIESESKGKGAAPVDNSKPERPNLPGGWWKSDQGIDIAIRALGIRVGSKTYQECKEECFEKLKEWA